MITLLRFARGHGWTGLPKNVLMGCCDMICDMISATQERIDTSGMTEEPYWRCAEMAQMAQVAQMKKGSQNPDSYVI